MATPHELSGIEMGRRSVPDITAPNNIFEVDSPHVRRQSTGTITYNPFVRREDDLPPLHKAASKGELEVIKHLIEEQKIGVNAQDSFDDTTALHKASQNNHIEVVKYLISQGANISAANNLGSMPLHFAASAGNREIAAYICNCSADKAIINAKDKYGSTPLILAVKRSNIDIANDLLLFGADVDQKRPDGRTSLHIACESGDLDMVKLLIERGAKVNARDNSHDTPLTVAISNNQIEVVKYLTTNQRSQIDFKVRDKNNRNLLHAAAAAENKEIMRIVGRCFERAVTPELGAVLLKEADSMFQNTPLHVAVQMKQYECAKILIRMGADPNQANKDGNTPLHIACDKGALDIARELIAAGGKLDVKNNLKITPRDILKKKNALKDLVVV